MPQNLLEILKSMFSAPIPSPREGFPDPFARPAKTIAEVKKAPELTKKPVRVLRPKISKTKALPPLTKAEERYLQEAIERIRAEKEAERPAERPSEAPTLPSSVESLQQLQEIMKQIGEKYKEYEKFIDEHKKRLEEAYAKYPKFPELKEIPEPPQRERIDTYKNLSNIGKAFISIGILATTLLGLKEKVPEAGLLAFAEMMRAFRENDDERFLRAVKDWQLQVEKIQNHNQKVLQEYASKLEEAKLDIEKAKELGRLDEAKINVALQSLEQMANMYMTMAQVLAKKEEEEFKRLKMMLEIQAEALKLVKLEREIELAKLKVPKTMAEIALIQQKTRESEARRKILLKKLEEMGKGEKTLEKIIENVLGTIGAEATKSESLESFWKEFWGD